MSTRTQAHSQSIPTNGRDQLSMSLQGHKNLSKYIRTQALNQSMPNQWAGSSINVSPGTQEPDQSRPNQWEQSAINVSPATQALDRSRPNQWGQSAINVSPGTQALDRSMPNQWARSSTHLFGTRIWLLSRSNKIRVSISTDVFEVYILQVKVNRCDYIVYVVISITWLR